MTSSFPVIHTCSRTRVRSFFRRVRSGGEGYKRSRYHPALQALPAKDYAFRNRTLLLGTPYVVIPSAIILQASILQAVIP